MTILIGSIFVGITAVQGTVQKLPFEAVGYWEYAGFDPGTSFDTGNWAAHIIDNVNTYIYVVGPIDGIGVATSIITNFNNNFDETLGVGIGFLEITGTWIGDDEFNGLPFYCYGRFLLNMGCGGFCYYGTVNLLGTLGDYTAQIRGDLLVDWMADYGFFGSSISGEIKIIS